eukprot:3037667-Rhodomonas_salina.1
MELGRSQQCLHTLSSLSELRSLHEHELFEEVLATRRAAATVTATVSELRLSDEARPPARERKRDAMWSAAVSVAT